MAYPDEYLRSDFYDKNGNFIVGAFDLIFRDKSHEGRSWSGLPDAIQRLSASYKDFEGYQLARDIGSLWGGLLTRVEAPNRWTASIHKGSPVRTWVYLRSEGLKENLQGDDMTVDGNVHHWAWGVALGADFGSQGSYINTAREITQFNGNWNNTSADIKIGNLGVEYGWHLTSNDLSVDQVPKIFNRYIHYPY